MLKINMKYRKGSLIVELKGKLENRSVIKLNKYLVAVILKHNIKTLIYDTKYLTFIEASGWEELIRGVEVIKKNLGKIYFLPNSKFQI